jgi:SAM-dependent methyltransferase
VPQDDYILLSDAEKARLQLQARVWEPETERLLDDVDIKAGWSCLDMGCGAMGVLGPLSRRVGSGGRVLGLEMDPGLLAAARQYIDEELLTNVELRNGDAFESGLNPDAFDLVHERFVLPHVADPQALLREMIRLTRPGGIVVVQEPDHSSWNFWPYHEKWPRLLHILESALALRGDINIGRRTFHMAKQAGLKDVYLRAGIVALQNSHPYMKMPLVAAGAMRSHMLSAGLASEAELDDLLNDIDQHASDSETVMISFTVTQVWGRKPGR